MKIRSKWIEFGAILGVSRRRAAPFMTKKPQPHMFYGSPDDSSFARFHHPVRAHYAA